MPDSIQMTFSNPINTSLQIGDTIYKSVVTAGVGATPIELGKCTALTSTVITCEIPTTLARPSGTDFILFSKNNKANLSSLNGYFAEVEMKNDSTDKIELYQVGSDVSESSK